MDEPASRTPADAAPTGPADGRTAFEPTARPEDDAFAVVDVEYLRELLVVFEPVDENAVLLIREGEGVRARSRSENCYWFDVAIPADAFDVFQVEDADVDLDVDALARAVDETTAPRMALHARDDGTLVVRDDTASYDVAGDGHPLDDVDDDERQYDRALFGIENMENVATTVRATDLVAVLDTDAERDHFGLVADLDAESLEAFFFDHDGDDRTVGFELDADDLLDPPTSPNGFVDPTDREATTVCRESLDDAIPPMRGAVELEFACSLFGTAVWLGYDRVPDAVHVDAVLTAEEGAADTLEALVEA